MGEIETSEYLQKLEQKVKELKAELKRVRGILVETGSELYKEKSAHLTAEDVLKAVYRELTDTGLTFPDDEIESRILFVKTEDWDKLFRKIVKKFEKRSIKSKRR